MIYVESRFDHNFITRWVELLIEGPRPFVLETLGNPGMHDMLSQLLSNKGGQELTEKLKKSIREIRPYNTLCMKDNMKTLLRSVDESV